MRARHWGRSSHCSRSYGLSRLAAMEVHDQPSSHVQIYFESKRSESMGNHLVSILFAPFSHFECRLRRVCPRTACLPWPWQLWWQFIQLVHFPWVCQFPFQDQCTYIHDLAGHVQQLGHLLGHRPIYRQGRSLPICTTFLSRIWPHRAGGHRILYSWDFSSLNSIEISLPGVLTRLVFILAQWLRLQWTSNDRIAHCA